jgi:hypothetical protein
LPPVRSTNTEVQKRAALPRAEGSETATADAGRQLLNIELRRLGQVVKKLTTEANLDDPNELRQVLVDAIRRDGQHNSRITEYEMDIRLPGRQEVLMTFVASAR